MPQIAESAFLAPSVVVIGDVVIGAEASVWPMCVLRGDVAPIRIGAKTNLQDGTIVHVTEGGQGTIIGDGVTIGHGVLLHDCTVEDGAFIGMRATMMDGARVERGGMLAAGALLTPHKVVKSGQIWAGSPAKYWRDINDAERAEFTFRAEEYVMLAKAYQ
ncbi:MAG: gamma carbonic anhydrase family protein [Bdellovibrionales bacterium]|jgi:carbonic anhydrase/acetyltransferase-like protein (isoleucine patch superfamily)